MRTERIERVLLGLVIVFRTRVGIAADVESPKPKPRPVGPGVVVHVGHDNFLAAELRLAEMTAIRIFASIGVPVVFGVEAKRKSDPKSPVRIEMQLDERAPAQLHVGAMAQATPYAVSGTRIHIFYDRVRQAQPGVGTGTILGYVMAHEISHVLQGSDRHSAAGVMKAHWDAADYRQMWSGALSFDRADAALILDALNRAMHLGRIEPPR